MLKAIRTLKMWQVVVLVLVVCAIGGGIYGIYNWANGSTPTTTSAKTQLVRVQYGNLTSSVSASGSLVYATSEQLTFGSAGTVEAIYVEKDSSVKKGDVLARLDSESIESLEGAVASARIALRNAEDALEKAQNPYTELEIAAANATVEQARQQFVDAQARGPLKIADAEYAVSLASQNYNNALVRFMNAQITSEELENVWRKLKAAELDLESVKQNTNKAVIDAQDNLVKAEDALGSMTVDPLEVVLKQSNLNSARATLDNALKQLESAKEGYPVVAPFDGVVAEVDVAPGDEVNANTVVLKLMDPSVIKVSATVDEIDVAQVQQGQKATVTLDAISDLELSGKVSSISAFANSQSGVVSYSVTIMVTSIPSGVQLREGMSATATITNQLASNVLLVPTKAISGKSTNNPVVTVMVNGMSEVRSVKLGASDDTSTEVVSGLNAGDMVVVTSSTSSSTSGSSSSSTGSQGGFTGGGGMEFPGGGFPDEGITIGIGR
ncbi:MAG: efflux RND transporter periplasmic adaptor subunit [Chloroflexi bacterium]|nr:efflux RND transporter periplasmic adaptor subunit [Chloroflexota bacterium]